MIRYHLTRLRRWAASRRWSLLFGIMTVQSLLLIYTASLAYDARENADDAYSVAEEAKTNTEDMQSDLEEINGELQAINTTLTYRK
jgi:hypothetical protein